MKLLIWLVIVFLVVAWIMRGKKNVPGRDGAGQRKPQAPADGAPEAMLQCACCGLHVPASEAVTHAPGVAFCSEEHRRRIFPGA